MTAPSVQVRAIDFFERATPLRIPFKFGASTLTEAPQVFVRADVAVDGKPATGQSAELLAPKWFDKNPALTNEQNFDQLRASLRGARRLFLDHGAAPSAFALHASVYPAHYAEAAKAGLNGLIASYGMALIDRAVLDALCRARGVSVFDALGAQPARHHDGTDAGSCGETTSPRSSPRAGCRRPSGHGTRSAWPIR